MKLPVLADRVGRRSVRCCYRTLRLIGCPRDQAREIAPKHLRDTHRYSEWQQREARP